MVDINWTLLFQILNFVLLFVVVGWFGFRPIMNVVEERQHRIASDIESAEKLKSDAIKVKRDSDKQLLDALNEAQVIVDKANKAAKEVYDQMLAQAREEQEHILKISKEQIEREKNNALMEVRAEVVSLSMLVAGKVVEQKLDSETDKKLINQFLDEVNNNKSGDWVC